MKKKTIMFLMNNVKYGGGETVVSNIIRNFSDQYNFIYACPKNPEKKMKILFEKYNITCYEFEKCSPFIVRKLIEETKPDIIHAHGFRASMCASYSMVKVPIVSHLHNYYSYLANINIKSLLFKLSCKRYRAVISCESEIAKNTIFRKTIENKSYIIENVVDYHNVIIQSNEYQSHKKFDLIFIGNLVGRKNPLEFINIIKDIKKDFPNLSVALVGSGELEAQCKELINNYDLNYNLVMTGFINNPLPLLKASKILVMTSTNEGLPMVALEALAMNKKIIANNNCGLNSLEDNNIVICNSNQEYQNKIKTILNNFSESSNYSGEKIQNDFERYLNQINYIYKEIV